MRNLFEKLQDACRKANVQEIEKLLIEAKANNPEIYKEAQKKVIEYLKFAKRQKEGVDKEILKSIDKMTFEGLIELAISMLAVMPKENKDQNEMENV